MKTQDELKFLGMRVSPSFVRERQGNGCAERFIRTLKENLLWVQAFETVEHGLAPEIWSGHGWPPLHGLDVDFYALPSLVPCEAIGEIPRFGRGNLQGCPQGQSLAATG